MRKIQRTIKTPVEFSGAGLFTGVPSTFRIEPAIAGSGLAFIRTDLPGTPRISVEPDHIAPKFRRTALASGDAEVETVEHLLSALVGSGVDNADIRVNAAELPHADGSVRPWTDLIAKAGFEEQGEPRRIYSLREAVAVSEKGAHVVALPSDTGLSVHYTLDYPGTPIGRQELHVVLDEETYLRDIAGARTFCLQHEAEALRNQGLAKGGTSANTLVVGPQGPIENTLRWPDEYVRHKILDLLGDLAILGGPLRAHIIAVGSGHTANLRLVQRIREVVDGRTTARRKEGALLDVREIEKILPHRYPFLMIDKVTEMDGYKRAVGIKNVTINEPFFQGHFPGRPIMPGVLQIEAMAQLAGALLMRKADKQGQVAVLLGMDNVKLRRNVVPGDQLRVEVETLKFKARSGEVFARASVDGQVAAEALLKFMILDEQA